MKRTALVLLVLATLGATAQAQTARTRAEVLAELAEARRNGDLIIAGCGGGTLREAFPNRYPPRLTATTLPPDDVQAPSASAERLAAEAGRAAPAAPRP